MQVHAFTYKYNRRYQPYVVDCVWRQRPIHHRQVHIIFSISPPSFYDNYPNRGISMSPHTRVLKIALSLLTAEPRSTAYMWMAKQKLALNSYPDWQLGLDLAHRQVVVGLRPLPTHRLRPNETKLLSAVMGRRVTRHAEL